MAQGFVPGYEQQQGAAPDPMAGMTAAQRMQYAREVEAAQTNARGNQIIKEMSGPKHLRDWNDLRSPVGIAKRNLEFDMKNDPTNRSLSGSSRGGGGGGGSTIAQQAAAQAYAQLSGIQFRGDGVTDFDRQKYADGQARQQQMDDWSMSKDAAQQGMAQQKFGMEHEAQGFKTREARQYEQLRNQIAQEQDPAKRQSAVQRMRDLNGTQQADPYLVVPGGQHVDENGKPYNMPSSVFNRQSGQFVQQQKQGGALPPGMIKQVGTSGGRPAYEDASGKRFSGG
jgi:hypothetical protein